MIQDPDARAIWNMASAGPVSANERNGNRLLRAVMLMHGLAMNGGPLHAVAEVSRAELTSSVTAYRALGLDDAADILEEVGRVDRSELDEEEEDALEVDSMERYFLATEADDRIEKAFLSHFRSHGSEYWVPSPVDHDR